MLLHLSCIRRRSLIRGLTRAPNIVSPERSSRLVALEEHGSGRAFAADYGSVIVPRPLLVVIIPIDSPSFARQRGVHQSGIIYLPLLCSNL